MKSRVAFAAIAGLAVAAGIGLWWLGHARSDEPARPDIAAAALWAANFRDPAGTPHAVGELQGKTIVLNFWATWCAPCRQEMPQLNRLYEKYRSSGFVLLGVNVDDDPSKAAEVATKLGVTFPVLLDANKNVSKLYDLNTMPSTVLIDREGTVRYVHRGYLAGYENNYEKQIRELLK